MKKVVKKLKFETPDFPDNTWLSEMISQQTKRAKHDFDVELVKYLKENLNTFGFDFNIEDHNEQAFLDFAANITRVEFSDDIEVKYYTNINGESKLIGVTNEKRVSFNYDPLTGLFSIDIG